MWKRVPFENTMHECVFVCLFVFDCFCFSVFYPLHFKPCMLGCNLVMSNVSRKPNIR